MIVGIMDGHVESKQEHAIVQLWM